MSMLKEALNLLVILIPATIVGALGGLLAARRFLSHHLDKTANLEPDEWTSAALDREAVRVATAQGRPEIAGLVSAKLHLLHRLGVQRRWQR
jgi:hypothetical protein